MLIGVEQIHDVHGPGEMGLDNRMVVTSPVGQHDHRLGVLQTPAQGLGIQTPAEERAGFNGPNLGGRVGVALRVALLVQADLGEHAAQLGLTGAGRAISLFATPSHPLAFAHWDPGAVKADVERGLGGSGGHRCADRLQDLFLLRREPLLHLAAHLFGTRSISLASTLAPRRSANLRRPAQTGMGYPHAP